MPQPVRVLTVRPKTDMRSRKLQIVSDWWVRADGDLSIFFHMGAMKLTRHDGEIIDERTVRISIPSWQVEGHNRLSWMCLRGWIRVLRGWIKTSNLVATVRREWTYCTYTERGYLIGISVVHAVPHSAFVIWHCRRLRTNH